MKKSLIKNVDDNTQNYSNQNLMKIFSSKITVKCDNVWELGYGSRQIIAAVLNPPVKVVLYQNLVCLVE